MSENNIPFEIQSEIIKRLPVKSLLRFRSVSKSYKSLIHSSDFIKHYTSQHQHLLVSCRDYKDSVNYEDKYISIVDDNNNNINNNTFPTHTVSVTLPESVKYPDLTIGTSHGLFCFYLLDAPTSGTARVLIFNPCIRKTLAFVVPSVAYGAYGDTYRTVIGFGVCPKTMDPKIVKITLTKSDEKPVVDCIPWEVEVFTLSTRAWRRPYEGKLPRKSVYICWDQVAVDGCLYWLARDRLYKWYYLIVSFDLTSEEFGEVDLPDSLAHGYASFSTHKLRESLAVIKCYVEAGRVVYDVWMMEHGVPKSFIKLYTISSRSPDVSILSLRGFRKTGELLIEVILRAQHGSTKILAAYDPDSESITNVGINGTYSSYSVYSYVETLLLL